MELKCLSQYNSGFMSLFPGDTTVDRGLSDEKKNQMITDFPDWFEVIEDGESKELEVETKVPLVESKEGGDSPMKKAAKAAKAAASK